MQWPLALVAFALVAGCGGAPIAAPAVADDPGYPAPPYGYAVNETLPDLLFAGKTVAAGADAASQPVQMISLGALRAGARYLVLETAGAWCSDCAGDQPSMMQLEADYAAKGVVGAELLLEGAYDAAATMPDLDGWSHDQGAHGTLLLDRGRAVEHAAGIIAFPSYFIVDASTLRIVVRSNDPLVARPLGPTLDALLQ